MNSNCILPRKREYEYKGRSSLGSVQRFHGFTTLFPDLCHQTIISKGVTAITNDYMIKELDLHHAPQQGNGSSQLHILCGRLKGTGRMIVGNDHGSCIFLQGLLDEFPWIDGIDVNRTFGHSLRAQDGV